MAAAGARQEREKARQAQATARSLRNRVQPVLDVMGPLTREMQAKALAIIKVMGQKLLQEQKEQQRQRKAEIQQTLGRKGRGRSGGMER